MTEPVKVAETIEKLIKAIGECRREIEGKGRAKAEAIRNYEKRMAIALATLKEAETYELAGRTYKAPPVTIMEKIAKGIAAEERYEMEIADSGYKAAVCNLEALQAQLNGFQSIFRHLDNM